MHLKKTFLSGLTLLLLSAWISSGALAQDSAAGSVYKVDPELCALMLRKGKEAFSRARYLEAKEYFRKAVQADPNSQKAWSHYDLTQMYTVAEQFKNHGRIVASTAPPPEQTAEPAPAPAAPAPAMAPAAPAKEKAAPIKEKAAPAKEKATPAKPEKPAASAPKEKAAPPEVKKPAEPSKPAVSAPAPPATPAAPAAPAPTPAPGGMKILKDEGC